MAGFIPVDEDAENSFERAQNNAVHTLASSAISRWSTREEIEYNSYNPKHDIYLGQSVPFSNDYGLVHDTQNIGFGDDRHLITLAGTRAGKGISCIIPNLLTYEGSVFCIDPKGENAVATHLRRGTGDKSVQGMGQDVFVLDPFQDVDIPPGLRASFNPMDFLPENDVLIYEAGALASSIVMVSERSDPYWSESARSLITTIIIHIMTSDYYCASDKQIGNKLPRNLLTLRKLLTGGSPHFVKVCQERIDEEIRLREERLEELNSDDSTSLEDVKLAQEELLSAYEAEPPYPFDAFLQEMMENRVFGGVVSRRAKSFKNIPPKERGSILSSACHETDFLDGALIETCLATSTFDVLALREKPTSLFLCLSTRYFDSHARWLRLVLGFTLNRFESAGTVERSHMRTLFLLDEMAVLGHMKSLEKAAGLMAGYGVKLWLILQDLNQLKRHYKDSWETFIGNAGALMAFGLSDNTTTEYLSKSLGKLEIIRELITSTTSRSEGESNQVGNQSPRQKSRASDALVPTHLSFGLTAKGDNKNQTVTVAKSSQLTVSNLMNPDEIKQYFSSDSGNMLVMLQGQRPMRLYRVRYYENHYFDIFRSFDNATKKDVLKSHRERRAAFLRKFPNPLDHY